MAKPVGAPPGYVGFEEGGELTNAVRKRPYTVVLLDEFEKAHREVANLLLQVLDEGHLTDSQGRKVDFKNTIIIMTSNIGADALAVASADTGISASTKKDVMERLRTHFSPEFLNRIDDIVMFNRLAQQSLRRIVDIRLEEIQGRLDQHEIRLDVDDSAREYFAQKGFDPVYGARPLQRVMQKELMAPLSRYIIEGSVRDGEVVKVTTQT